MAKVPVQKGPIRADVPTRKSQSPEGIYKEDMENHNLRKSGQILHFHEPKTRGK